MAGEPGRHATMTPLDISLIAATLPSALRQRLASFRKAMLVEGLDGASTTSSLPRNGTDASERLIIRDIAGDKQEQIRVVEEELSRPSSSSSSYPSTPGNRTPGQGAVAKDVDLSGVAWNRVSPGSALLQNATYEVQKSEPDNELARSLFINGFLYLLDALPKDLSPEETTIIRSKLPEGLERTIPICAGNNTDNDNSVRRGRPRSFIRRVLATGIIQIFLIIHFLVPYVKLLLQRLYRYERNYHITERMLAVSIGTLDNLGKSDNHDGTDGCRVGEGDAGQPLQDIVVWGLEESVRGVLEGVGEGLTIMGVGGAGSRQNSG